MRLGRQERDGCHWRAACQTMGVSAASCAVITPGEAAGPEEADKLSETMAAMEVDDRKVPGPGGAVSTGGWTAASCADSPLEWETADLDASPSATSTPRRTTWWLTTRQPSHCWTGCSPCWFGTTCCFGGGGQAGGGTFPQAKGGLGLLCGGPAVERWYGYDSEPRLAMKGLPIKEVTWKRHERLNREERNKVRHHFDSTFPATRKDPTLTLSGLIHMRHKLETPGQTPILQSSHRPT